MHYVAVNSEGYLAGFYDDTTHTPEQIPAGAYPLSDENWLTWIDNQANCRIVNGAFVYSPPPPPSPLALSQEMLGQKLAAGISIVSEAAPNVNATYALDTASTGQIFQIGLYASQFGVFPGGTPNQFYPDIQGRPHSFPVATFISFFQAVASLVSDLNTQQGIMAVGGPPAWPAQIANIV